jgi:hypothetical protein
MYGFTSVLPRTLVPLANNLINSAGGTLMKSFPESIHSLRQAAKEAKMNVIPRTNQLTSCGSGFHPARFQSDNTATMLPPVNKTFHSRQSAATKDVKSRSTEAWYHRQRTNSSLRRRGSRRCQPADIAACGKRHFPTRPQWVARQSQKALAVSLNSPTTTPRLRPTFALPSARLFGWHSSRCRSHDDLRLSTTLSIFSN